MVFVSSKLYLLMALVLYVASIYLCDILADYIAYYIEGSLRDLFFPPNWGDHAFGWAGLTRRFLLGELLPILFFIIIPCFFFKSPTLYCYAGFKRSPDESLVYPFLRMIRDIFISLIIIILFVGCLQGFFFWIKWGYGLFLHLVVKPDYLNGITSETKTLEIINQQLAWLKHFNISILIIILIRSGILVTIIQGLIYNDQRLRLTPGKKIAPFLAIPIILAAVLIPQHITYIPKPYVSKINYNSVKKSSTKANPYKSWSNPIDSNQKGTAENTEEKPKMYKKPPPKVYKSAYKPKEKPYKSPYNFNNKY